MSELEDLKQLVNVLTHQRNVAFDNLARVEAMLIKEREAAAAAKEKADVVAAKE